MSKIRLTDGEVSTFDTFLVPRINDSKANILDQEQNNNPGVDRLEIGQHAIKSRVSSQTVSPRVCSEHARKSSNYVSKNSNKSKPDINSSFAERIYYN